MIELTKEVLQDVAKDLAIEIAEKSVKDYILENFITSEEAESLYKIIQEVSVRKICNVMGGYCS